jgi:hypothetical protein
MRPLRASSFAPLRWAAVLPAALLAAACAQVFVFAPILWGLTSSLGQEPAWLRWLAKSIATPIMAAAFIGAATWCAPTRRRIVALSALVVVTAWGTLLIAAGPSTWGPVMGMLGIAGGIATAWWTWHVADE